MLALAAPHDHDADHDPSEAIESPAQRRPQKWKLPSSKPVVEVPAEIAQVAHIRATPTWSVK